MFSLFEEKLKAELALIAMKEDKKKAAESDDTLYITFDLQQLQPLPRITTSIAFYLRKLVYLVGGLKGSNEIA